MWIEDGGRRVACLNGHGRGFLFEEEWRWSHQSGKRDGDVLGQDWNLDSRREKVKLKWKGEGKLVI